MAENNDTGEKRWNQALVTRHEAACSANIKYPACLKEMVLAEGNQDQAGKPDIQYPKPVSHVTGGICPARF
jgi:hypothetical protein